MIALTGYTVVPYLIGRQLINRSDLFAGRCIVQEDSFGSTRNNNFVIKRGASSPLFIKQPKSFNQIEGGLTREIQFYQEFGQSLGSVAVSLSPRKCDEVNQILIFDFLPSPSLYVNLISKFCLVPAGETLTRVVGEQVALAHSLTNKSQLPARHPFQSMKPWMLTVQKVYLNEMKGSDNMSLARLGSWLLNNGHILDELANDWNESHVIHGDLHWSNLLVTNADVNTPELRLIDWEFAALGDPFWDVATLLSDYLIQSVVTSGLIPTFRLPVLTNALFAAYAGQHNTTSAQYIIRLTGLATLHRYYNWISNQNLPPGVQVEALHAQAISHLTNPTAVLKTWETL